MAYGITFTSWLFLYKQWHLKITITLPTFRPFWTMHRRKTIGKCFIYKVLQNSDRTFFLRGKTYLTRSSSAGIFKNFQKVTLVMIAFHLICIIYMYVVYTTYVDISLFVSILGFFCAVHFNPARCKRNNYIRLGSVGRNAGQSTYTFFDRHLHKTDILFYNFMKRSYLLTMKILLLLRQENKTFSSVWHFTLTIFFFLIQKNRYVIKNHVVTEIR